MKKKKKQGVTPGMELGALAEIPQVTNDTGGCCEQYYTLNLET